MPGSAKDRLIRATSWHAGGRVAAGLLGVLQSAYAFRALEETRYGLLTLVGVFTILLVLVEMGLRTTTVHFTAEAAGRGDPEEARRVLGSASLFHLVAGSVVALPFMLLAGPFADLLGVEEGLRGEAVGLLRWMAAFLVLGNAASGWTSVLVAKQRTGPVAAGMVLGGVAQIAALVWGVRAGAGAVALGYGFAAGTLVRAAVESAAAHRAFPGISILPWHATRETLRRLLSVGRHLQVARVVDMLVFNIDQVFVSVLLGFGAAGIYRFASDLVLKLREVPLLLCSGILPAATEIRGADDGEALRRLYLRGTKYVVAAAAFGAAFTAAAAPQILSVAGGGRAVEAAAALALLSVGVLANVAAGVGTQVGVAVGRTDLQARAAAVTAVVSILLVPAFLSAGMGLTGAGGATALALVSGAAWYLGPLHRALGIPGAKAFREAYLPPLLPAAGVGVAVLLLNRNLPGELWQGGKERTLAVLGVEGAVMGALFLGTLLLCGWVDSFDRDVLRRALAPRAAGGKP